MKKYLNKIENQYNMAIITGNIDLVKELTPTIGQMHSSSNIQENVNVNLISNYINLAIDYEQKEIVKYLLDFCGVRHSFLSNIPNLMKRALSSSPEIFSLFRETFPNFYYSTLHDNLHNIASIISEDVIKLKVVIKDILEDNSLIEKANFNDIIKYPIGPNSKELFEVYVPLLKSEAVCEKLNFDNLIYECLYYEDIAALNIMIEVKGVEILNELSRYNLIEALRRNKGSLIEDLIINSNYIPNKDVIEHMNWFIKEYEKDAEAIPNSPRYTNSIKIIQTLEKKQFNDKLNHDLSQDNKKSAKIKL